LRAGATFFFLFFFILLVFRLPPYASPSRPYIYIYSFLLFFFDIIGDRGHCLPFLPMQGSPASPLVSPYPEDPLLFFCHGSANDRFFSCRLRAADSSLISLPRSALFFFFRELDRARFLSSERRNLAFSASPPAVSRSQPFGTAQAFSFSQEGVTLYLRSSPNLTSPEPPVLFPSDSHYHIPYFLPYTLLYPSHLLYNWMVSAFPSAFFLEYAPLR